MNNINNDFWVTFDNGGGIVIENDNFCHYYYNAALAAVDANELLDGDDASSWDGHEEDMRGGASQEYSTSYNSSQLRSFLKDNTDTVDDCSGAESLFFKKLNKLKSKNN